jgi:hypothetical protein
LFYPEFLEERIEKDTLVVDKVQSLFERGIGLPEEKSFTIQRRELKGNISAAAATRCFP